MSDPKVELVLTMTDGREYVVSEDLFLRFVDDYVRTKAKAVIQAELDATAGILRRGLAELVDELEHDPLDENHDGYPDLTCAEYAGPSGLLVFSPTGAQAQGRVDIEGPDRPNSFVLLAAGLEADAPRGIFD